MLLAVILSLVSLRCEQALFPSKVLGGEGKTSKRARGAASVTRERRCCEPLVARASEDEQKERTALISYNNLDATLTGRINNVSTLF